MNQTVFMILKRIPSEFDFDLFNLKSSIFFLINKSNTNKFLWCAKLYRTNLIKKKLYQANKFVST